MKRGRNRRRALKDQLSPFVGRSVPLIVTGGEKINVRYAEKNSCVCPISWSVRRRGILSIEIGSWKRIYLTDN